MNKVIISGRLTKDPELKFLTDGKAVATFTLAVNRMKKGEADFIKVIHKKHSHTVNTYEQIRFELHQNPTDYSPLFLKCYRCHERGHIATQCEFFSEIKGNLIKKKNINLEDIREQEAMRIENEQGTSP